MDEFSLRRMLKSLKRDLFPALERKVYRENIKSAVLRKEGKAQSYLVYDTNDSIKWWYLEQKGAKAFACENILDMAELPAQEIRITDTFWTCSCNHYFIHHKVQAKCPICKLTVEGDTKILNVLKG
jgi:rubrerythrin